MEKTPAVREKMPAVREESARGQGKKMPAARGGNAASQGRKRPQLWEKMAKAREDDAGNWEENVRS